jgi:hypothetical protein
MIANGWIVMRLLALFLVLSVLVLLAVAFLGPPTLG